MPIRRIVDNLRRDNPEAREFIYPDDSKRISGKDAAKGAAMLGGATAEGLLRSGLPLPLRAIKPFAERIGAVINRPDATKKMHQSYLNDKYGERGWDIYQNRGGFEERNPAFDYSETPVNDNTILVQREDKRFAGDVLSDEWLESIRQDGTCTRWT